MVFASSMHSLGRVTGSIPQLSYLEITISPELSSDVMPRYRTTSCDLTDLGHLIKVDQLITTLQHYVSYYTHHTRIIKLPYGRKRPTCGTWKVPGPEGDESGRFAAAQCT